MSEVDPLIVGNPLDELLERLGPEEDVPLTEADYQSIRDLNLTSCDFVGDSGCVNPNCWQCHSPIGPQNLRTLADNLTFAALLCWAWQLRDVCPTWRPGCEELPADLPPLMKAALGSSRVGAFLRRRGDG